MLFGQITRRGRVPGRTHQQRIGDTRLSSWLDCYYPAVPDPRSSECGRLPTTSRRTIASCLGVGLLLASLTSAAILGAPRAPAASLAGMAIFLDPGHNGVFDSSITQQVPNGRGGTKHLCWPRRGKPPHSIRRDSRNSSRNLDEAVTPRYLSDHRNVLEIEVSHAFSCLASASDSHRSVSNEPDPFAPTHRPDGSYSPAEE